MYSFLILVHLLGLAMGMGAATVKMALLLKCRKDERFIPTYLNIVHDVTRIIIAGLILLTLSGIGFLVTGYPFTATLIVKLVLVASMWGLGPYIDNVVEPRFIKLAQEAGKAGSPEFRDIKTKYFRLDTFAGLLFYLITAIWVLA